jgi:gluconokinase
MGVAGSGKTLIGTALAERLEVPFADADEFHPPANIAKMTAGHPLDDNDRRPWLEAIAAWIHTRSLTGEGGVVTCSALTRRYRDQLRSSGAPVWFCHLVGDRELITQRVASRSHHFMPSTLVASQFQALQPLQTDEPGLAVSAAGTVEEIVEQARSALAGLEKGTSP